MHLTGPENKYTILGHLYHNLQYKPVDMQLNSYS